METFNLRDDRQTTGLVEWNGKAVGTKSQVSRDTVGQGGSYQCCAGLYSMYSHSIDQFYRRANVLTAFAQKVIETSHL